MINNSLMSSAHLDLRNLRYLQDCDLQTIEQADFPGGPLVEQWSKPSILLQWPILKVVGAWTSWTNITNIAMTKPWNWDHHPQCGVQKFRNHPCDKFILVHGQFYETPMGPSTERPRCTWATVSSLGTGIFLNSGLHFQDLEVINTNSI